MSKTSKKPKNKKETIIRFAMIIAIVIVIVVTYNFINNLQRIKIPSGEYRFFQYVMGNKTEYTGVLEFSGKDGITKLECKEGTIYLESMPVYYESERDKVILPADMAVVFPMDSGRTNKVNSLSIAYINYGDVYIQKGDLDKNLEDAFLYDGNDMYFFVENTTVTIDGVEYKLPPLSYANVTYKGYIELYNYDTDEYTYIEEVVDDVIAATDKYSINLSNDTLKYEDTEQILLKRIKNLKNLD